MSTGLHRLVYLSRNRLGPAESDGDRELAAILESARKHNARAGVTGALMFNSGCFAQVLEGDHDAIQEVFERIQCDTRHDRVTVLSFGPVVERIFPDWSMAYVGTESTALAEYEHFASDSGFDAEAGADDRLIALMREHLFEAETG